MARLTQAVDEREDAELLAAIAQSRDQTAFSELLRRYEQDAFALALHIAGNREWAEETVQEAMIRVWTSAASFRGEGPVKAWLLRVVARECLKIIKSMKRKSAKMESESGRDPQDSAASPLKAAESLELSQALRSEFNRLPEFDRQLIGLHFGGGLTQQEISQALSIPQQTISYRLTGILKSLRANLTSAGYTAVLPLLSAKGFTEALCSGHECPAGLHDKVLSKLTGARASARSRRSVRKTNLPAGKPGTLALSVVAIAVVAGGALWAVSSQPKAAPPIPQVQDTRAGANDPIGPLSDWHKRWTFENGVPRDLWVVLDSSWTINPVTQCAEITKGARFFPTYSLPEQPLLFVAHGKGINLIGDVVAGLVINKDGHELVPPRQWNKRHTFDSTDVTQYFYIYHKRLVMAMNGDPGMVVELPEDAAGGIPVFALNNYAMHDFNATPLTEAEVPDFVKHPEEIIKTMKPVPPNR